LRFNHLHQKDNRTLPGNHSRKFSTVAAKNIVYSLYNLLFLLLLLLLLLLLQAQTINKYQPSSSE